jgi:hypothetical protein
MSTKTSSVLDKMLNAVENMIGVLVRNETQKYNRRKNGIYRNAATGGLGLYIYYRLLKRVNILTLFSTIHRYVQFQNLCTVTPNRHVSIDNAFRRQSKYMGYLR